MQDSLISWQPGSRLDTLRKRALLMDQVRSFFKQRQYLEVETPIMARFGVTDPYLENIQARFRAQDYCLQTSPEYHMKRLLAAGSGPIFQISRVFRDDELGRWHNPEFSLLEWYQLGIDHLQLLEEVDQFLQTVAGAKALHSLSYQDAFQQICDCDPIAASEAELRDLLGRYALDQVFSSDEGSKDAYLFLLMSHVIEPALADFEAPVALYHFPASQASLAKVEQGLAQRFEVYWRGVELANGFHELQDASAQALRFEEDRLTRKQRKQREAQADHYLLAALEAGLPSCSGVALGIDRLAALVLKANNLSEVMAFAIDRA